MTQKRIRKRQKPDPQNPQNPQHSPLGTFELSDSQQSIWGLFNSQLNTSVSQSLNTYEKFECDRNTEFNDYWSANKQSHFHENSVMLGRDLKKFCHTLQSVFTRHRVLISIDLEAWERNNNIITEIGISIYDPRIHLIEKQLAGKCPLYSFHIIIAEHYKRRNGRYVSDCKDDFLGESIVLKEAEALLFVQYLLDSYFPSPDSKSSESMFPAALVGHGVANDLKWLKKMGIKLPDLLDPVKEEALIDTQWMWKCHFGQKFNALHSLLKFFQIPYKYLHNAGNDSYYTLLVLLVMCDVSMRKTLYVDCVNAGNLPLSHPGNFITDLQREKNEILDRYTDGFSRTVSTKALVQDLYENGLYSRKEIHYEKPHIRFSSWEKASLHVMRKMVKDFSLEPQQY